MLYTDGTTEATRADAEEFVRSLDAADLDVGLEANRQALQDAIDGYANLNPLNIAAEKDASDIVGTNGADETMVVVEVPANGTAWESASRNLIRNIAIGAYDGTPLDADPTRVRMNIARALSWIAKVATSV